MGALLRVAALLSVAVRVGAPTADPFVPTTTSGGTGTSSIRTDFIVGTLLPSAMESTDARALPKSESESSSSDPSSEESSLDDSCSEAGSAKG